MLNIRHLLIQAAAATLPGELPSSIVILQPYETRQNSIFVTALRRINSHQDRSHNANTKTISHQTTNAMMTKEDTEEEGFEASETTKNRGPKRRTCVFSSHQSDILDSDAGPCKLTDDLQFKTYVCI